MPARGRPYTQLEMKTIVDYLVEHRAYGEVKARKMWQDFARSGIVNRTWQSMKETFLKRILPDIHNTYYRLTPAQKRSFKEGCDVEARESKNSGKMQTTSNKSGSTGTGDRNDNQGASAASCSKNTGEATPDTPSKITSRSKASTDTIVLENNYETAEQILHDLESSEDKENSDEPQSPSKTLRDYIAYSEPLTPMLQEVIDDFATDEDEPQLQIVEDYELVNSGNSVTSERSKSPLEIRRSERLSPTKPLGVEKRTPQKENNEDRDERKGISRSPSISKVRTLKLKKTRKGWEKKPQGSPSKKESGNDDKIEKSGEASVAEKINKTADKDRTTLTDTPLPNNQEQLGNNADAEKSMANDKRTSIEGSTEEFQEHNKKKAVKRRRSRSASSTGVKRQLRKDTQTEKQEIKEMIHKLLENNTQVPASIVDTQTYDSHPNIVANKTVQENKNETFNSHGNQVKLTCETQADQNSQNENNKNEVPETNPCLQSVSLYAEQFSTTRYSDSENGDNISQSKDNTAESNKKTNEEAKDDNSKKLQDSNDAKNSKDSNTSKNVQESNNYKHSEHPNNANKLEEKNNNNTQVQSDNKTDNAESLTPETVGKTVRPFTQDVVVLKSNSESDQSQKSPQDQEGSNKVVRGWKSRDEALANIFGFASGAATLTTVSKKGGKVNVKPKHRHFNGYFLRHLDSGSSDNTSDSEGEEMSHFRDYELPKSYKILSHERSKFITEDKKIYPLLENGKYILSRPVDDCEEQTDSYWKAKYLEERKKLAEEKIRGDELAMRLKRANDSEARRPRSVSRSKSPMMSERSAKRRRRYGQDETIDISSDVSKCSKTSKESEKTVKIKINNKKEIELECGWSHVPSVLEKMASIFQEKEAKPSTETVKVVEKTRTPTPEVSEKVNRIEREIFNQIAEKDKIETSSKENVATIIEVKEDVARSGIVSNENVTNIQKLSDDNVTKRKRGRPRKTSPSSSISSVESSTSKIIKLSVNEQVPSAPKTDNRSKKPEAEMPTPAHRTNVIQVQAIIEKEPVKRITRAPKKLSEVEALPTTDGRRSRSKLSVSERGHVDIPDDPNVKYKFPHKSRSQSDTEAAKTNTSKYLTPSSRFMSPVHASRRSVDSSQGYLDTDSSPSPLKKKKKRSSPPNRPKSTNSRRSYADSHPYQGDIDTCDSQRSQTPEKTAKTSTSPNKKSSPNTSVYRSDSFQLLMPQSRAKSVTVTHLDKIDEKSRSAETQYFSLSPMSVKGGDEFEFAAGTRTENTSSNMSLTSPEISVVEKQSVSKETLLLNDSADIPTIRETLEGMETSAQSAGNNMVSEVDVGFPMIEQDCEVQKTAMSVSDNSLSNMSSSILNSIPNAECEDQSLSESLDVRLRNLFLESAKKIAQQIQEKHLDIGNKDNMDMDQIMATVKKARGKRSSTPQKKRRSTKSTGPVLIEHVESCSKSKWGRRSCPPIINVIQCTSPPRTDVKEISAVEPAKRGRHQKDFIKVKIQRPRDKSLPKERRALSSSRMSVCTDSGINETDRTESDLMRCSDDSVQLIHNHSETCLQAHECIEDDFQFPRKHSDKVNDTVRSPQDIFTKAKGFTNNNIKDLLCDDALDASEFISAARQSQGSQEADSAPSSNPSMLSYGSLMTDDLSDESPPEPPKQSKWYLLSEDETNSVNDPKPPENSAGICFSHSNLKQLFLGYSIPDLSTISEGSREDSTKPNFDSNSTTY